MSEEYFKNALADFAQDMANGGAIRHLWDLGHPISRIMEQLDFPAPYERVQNAVWEHLLATGTISLEKPADARRKARADYVKEYDKYGRTSFRRVVKAQEEGADAVYAPCDFGLALHADREWYEKMLACLDARQREYVTDIPWKRMRVYHVMDEMFLGITKSLKEKNLAPALEKYDD